MALSDDEKEEVRVIIAEQLSALKLAGPLGRAPSIQDGPTRTAVAALEDCLRAIVRRFG